jgi:hypothetical protein
MPRLAASVADKKVGGLDLDFTRRSDPVAVHVPSSVRPVAPHVLYVVPTFGWQRETQTNQKRSVRIGGGLRVYLDGPWYSSGIGELLGAALWTGGQADREDWKGFITQWGAGSDVGIRPARRVSASRAFH